jgi:hypothetical protein
MSLAAQNKNYCLVPSYPARDQAEGKFQALKSFQTSHFYGRFGHALSQEHDIIKGQVE